MSKKIVSVGKALADYLSKLRKEYPNYQLGSLALIVSGSNSGAECLTYSITGDPVLSDEVLEAVCNEDLKDELVPSQEDDRVVIQFHVSMISTVTKGIMSFVEHAYDPGDCLEERESDDCSKEQVSDVAPDIEFSASLKEMQEAVSEMKKYFDKVGLFPFGAYYTWKKDQCDCNRCKRNSEK